MRKMNGFKRLARRETSASKFLLGTVLLCLLPCFCASCASRYAEHLRDVRRDYYEFGDLSKTKDDVERRQKRAPQKEQAVLALNAASLALSSGEIDDAKSNLLAVRDEFDELETQRAKLGAENVLSLWIDDNTKSYEGEDYEKIMIRATLAIADLLDGGKDARAFAYQIAAKQDEIVRGGETDDPQNSGKKYNPKKNYPRVPLGPYIEGLLWEESYANQSEAARCYEKVVKWRPDFKQGKADLLRAQKSVHSQPGFGRVYVFAFVGRGPRKEQVYEPVSQVSLLIADQIFSAVNKYSVPPTVAPVPIPALVEEEPRIACVACDLDGARQATTETLADVNEMARKQFEATKDQILAKAVIRRVVKKSTIYVAKEAGRVNGWISLAADVGGVVWEATETADTRCWGLLPAEIQVASFEAPVGKHKITFYPGDGRGEKIGDSLSKTIKVDANRNTYVLVNYPDREPIGTIISSDDPRKENAE